MTGVQTCALPISIQKYKKYKYDKKYKCTVLATVAAGYADGFRREISNKGCVKIHGVDCPVRGKVCMDMFMVEIPEELKDKVSAGDEVILYGKDIVEQSKIMGISIYEIFTGIGERVDREAWRYGFVRDCEIG